MCKDTHFSRPPPTPRLREHIAPIPLPGRLFFAELFEQVLIRPRERIDVGLQGFVEALFRFEFFLKQGDAPFVFGLQGLFPLCVRRLVLQEDIGGRTAEQLFDREMEVVGDQL